MTIKAEDLCEQLEESLKTFHLGLLSASSNYDFQTTACYLLCECDSDAPIDNDPKTLYYLLQLCFFPPFLGC